MLQDLAVINDQQLTGLVCMNQAQNLRYLGDHEASRIKWYQALDHYQNSNDSVPLIRCLEGLVKLRLLDGEVEKAGPDVRRIQNFWLGSGNLREEANAKLLNGLLECRKGNFGKCIEYATGAFEIHSKIRSQSGKGQSMELLAKAYAGLENWDQALQYYQRSLAELTLGTVSYTHLTLPTKA